jgi:hypothetical protein
MVGGIEVGVSGSAADCCTIPMPTWVKVAIDASTLAAGVAEGHVLRPVNRADQVRGSECQKR